MDRVAGKPAATKKESGTVDLSESETWSFHEEEVTWKTVASKTSTGKFGESSNSENSGNPKAERVAAQFTHVSSHSASHGCIFLDRKKNLRTRARGPNGGPERERGYLGHTPENDSSSSSSSWSRL